MGTMDSLAGFYVPTFAPGSWQAQNQYVAPAFASVAPQLAQGLLTTPQPQMPSPIQQSPIFKPYVAQATQQADALSGNSGQGGTAANGTGGEGVGGYGGDPQGFGSATGNGSLPGFSFSDALSGAGKGATAGGFLGLGAIPGAVIGGLLGGFLGGSKDSDTKSAFGDYTTGGDAGPSDAGAAPGGYEGSDGGFASAAAAGDYGGGDSGGEGGDGGGWARGGRVAGHSAPQKATHNGGLIQSAAPGRADTLPVALPRGAYVMPADVVSQLGQGNTNAGARVLDKRVPGDVQDDGKYARGGVVHGRVSGGEYVVAPHRVAAMGGGDPRKGAGLLDYVVRKTRADNAQQSGLLPGPK